MRDYLRTVELVEALARMVNRVIQHGKAEAQSALGSIEEIRTTLAAVANIDDFFETSDPFGGVTNRQTSVWICVAGFRFVK